MRCWNCCGGLVFSLKHQSLARTLELGRGIALVKFKGVAARAIMLVALSIWLGEAGDASAAPRLPSRNAEVVIPILLKFSPPDNSRKTILSELRKILGDPDDDSFGGKRHQETVDYFLKQRGIKVTAVFQGEGLILIAEPTPSDPDRILYPRSKLESN